MELIFELNLEVGRSLPVLKAEKVFWEDNRCAKE